MNGINTVNRGNAFQSLGLPQGLLGNPGLNGGAGFQSGLQNFQSSLGGLPTNLNGIGDSTFSTGAPGFGNLEQQSAQLTQTLAALLQFLGSAAANGNQGGGGGGGQGGGNSGAGAVGDGGGGGGSSPTGGGGVSGSAPSNDTKDEGEIKSFIGQAASAYGADPKVLTEMARLESSFKTDVVNDWDSNAKKGTPSKGLFQFIEPTFKAYSKQAKEANPQAWEGMGEPNFSDWRHQALTAAWAVKNGHGSAWATYGKAGGK